MAESLDCGALAPSTVSIDQKYQKKLYRFAAANGRYRTRVSYRRRTMPKSYAQDPRERVIEEAVEMGTSRHEAANRDHRGSTPRRAERAMISTYLR
jgi:hypothetical protein